MDLKLFKNALALEHFGASMQRAKRLPTLKSILDKLKPKKPQDTFRSLTSALRGSMKRQKKRKKKVAEPKDDQ